MSKRTRYRFPVFLCCFAQQRCRPAGRGCARGRTGFRRHGRGASPPASPCFFVVEHHVTGSGQAFGGADVVLHCPQTLVSSSRGTTSLGPIRLSSERAWCFTARQPLFLRRGAPRHWARLGFRSSRRGASPPASPCFFVVGHHVTGPGQAFGGSGVVLHCPQTLISSSRGTTPPISTKRTIPVTRPGFPEFPSPQKTKNVGAGAAHAAPRRHFPFSPINR